MAGAIRERLAKMLSAKLVEMGIPHLAFSGDDLMPVSGYWKSQDCYRWESVGLKALHPDNGNPMSMNISGWATMTSIVRSGGVEISRSYRGFPYEFEAEPLP